MLGRSGSALATGPLLFLGHSEAERLDCPEAWEAAARWDGSSRQAPQQSVGRLAAATAGQACLTLCLWLFQTSQAQALPGAAEAAGAPGPRQHPPHHTEPPEARQDAHQGEQGCPSATTLPATRMPSPALCTWEHAHGAQGWVGAARQVHTGGLGSQGGGGQNRGCRGVRMPWARAGFCWVGVRGRR